VTPNEQLRKQIKAMPPVAWARFERQVAEQLKRSADRQGKPVPPKPSASSPRTPPDHPARARPARTAAALPHAETGGQGWRPT